MKHLRRFNESSEGSVTNVSDDVNIKVLKGIPDERDDIEVGDVVLASYFMGGYDTYEFEVKYLDNDDVYDVKEIPLEKLGNVDHQSVYALDLAFHVVKKSTYDKAVK